MRILPSILLTAQAVAASSFGGERLAVKRENHGLQNIVTYDEHSLLIRGERIFIFSGEFHPYRLPVPGLWLDIFQKVKSLGFSAVSFYTHWALFEGEPGVYRADGVFDLEPFFAAASEAGIYLIARPGPYINAESSGGGFPGWFQRVQGLLRTRAPDYLEASNVYASNVGSAIAQAQITNGGPVILVQAENEYSQGSAAPPVFFPDPVYMKYVEDQLRNASITVPMIVNDAQPHGYFAPGSEINGTSKADVDIYGYDNYALGFNCADPTNWPSGKIPTSFESTHLQQSPSGFDSIPEFQGGSFDPWGGSGFAQCEILLNHEFERVFYKNNFGAAVALLNLYMIWGGTNWGNLGHDGGYTSYDYGASISEDRSLMREKYSELKLEANFLRVTPSYLTVSVGNLSADVFTTGDVVATPLIGTETASNFYILRHGNFAQTTASNYNLINITTSLGTVSSIPQLGGTLTLGGRDSKWFVTDYDAGGTVLLYSTAEIFTWKVVEKKTFVIVYGGPDEVHELAIKSTSQAKTIEGTGITTHTTNNTTILNWAVSPTRRVVQVGSLFIYILDRNTAYNYWTLDFPRTDVWGNFTANLGNTTSVIIEAGYLVRTASVDGASLKLTGDLNATVPLKVIGAPSGITTVTFNGDEIEVTQNDVTGELTSTLTFTPPHLIIPDLASLSWKFLDNLPEIQPNYSDALWQPANLNKTLNSYQAQLTPTSLFGSDYGFNTGVLLFRGHFTARGTEETFTIHTIGGSAFASSVFLNSTHIGSWPGTDASRDHNDTYSLPNLVAGASYVFTVLVDNQGLRENGKVGNDSMKTPRGILDFSLRGRAATAIAWKVTGNLGGERYVDKVRGPLNEGGFFAERQGFTQPRPPSQEWPLSSPWTGTAQAGVAFYAAELPLDLPTGYDIPLSFVIANTTRVSGSGPDWFRAQLWVNGWQFGKYVNNIGPQTTFPVPEGILNHRGTNWIGLEIWAQQAAGAALANFSLVPTAVVQSGYGPVALVDSPRWTPRPGAY